MGGLAYVACRRNLHQRLALVVDGHVEAGHGQVVGDVADAPSRVKGDLVGNLVINAERQEPGKVLACVLVVRVRGTRATIVGGNLVEVLEDARG